MPMSLKKSSEFPLSLAQEQVWLHDQMATVAAPYHVSVGWYVAGPFQKGAFDLALRDVVVRHESLRSTFGARDDGWPMQRVRPDAAIDRISDDFRRLPADRIRSEADNRAAAIAMRPFDLERGPVLRAHTIQTGVEEHLIVLTIHHLVIDEWSLELLLDELAQCYDSRLHNRVYERPPVTQYRSYVEQQRATLASQDFENTVRTQYEGLDAALKRSAVPLDHPRPRIGSFFGAAVTLLLPAKPTKQLLDAGAVVGATPFMVFLSLWQLLLAGWTKRWEVASGTVLTDRPTPEIQSTIGLFANTVVLRQKIDPAQDYEQALRQTRDSVVTALCRVQVPHSVALRMLSNDRRLIPSLPGNMLTLHQSPRAFVSVPDQRLDAWSMKTVSSRFDLECHVSLARARPEVRLVYATDVLSPKTVVALGSTLHCLTALAATNRELTVCELLTEAQRAAGRLTHVQ